MYKSVLIPLSGALLLVFTACTTLPPTEYYQLSCNVDKAPASDQIAGSLTVLPFRVATPYAGKRIAYRDNPYRIHYDEYRHWAAPPAELIQREITECFRAAAIFDSVENAATSTADSRYTLRGTVQEFVERNTNGKRFALLRMSLTFNDSESGAQLSMNTSAQVEAAGNGDLTAFAEAMSKALEKNVTAGRKRIIEFSDTSK